MRRPTRPPKAMSDDEEFLVVKHRSLTMSRSSFPVVSAEQQCGCERENNSGTKAALIAGPGRQPAAQRKEESRVVH